MATMPSPARCDAAAEDLGLQLRVLGHGLDHQVGAVDRGLDVGRGLDRLGRADIVEQPGLDVAARALEQRLAGSFGQLGGRVGEPYLQAGAREVAGDPAAHRPAAQHRNRLHAGVRTPPR